MAGMGWLRGLSSGNRQDAQPMMADGTPPPAMGVDVAYPMQKVMIRWHTLDGGEVSIPGQIQDVTDEMVEVWFDRNVASYNPLHSDDRVWLDTFEGENTFVFSGWIIGMRPPDTMVINVEGLPRRDQRRQHVRELVSLPPQTVVQVDDAGEPCGPVMEVMVHDLSGGGARLELHIDVEKDSKLMLTLDLNDVPFDAVLTVVDVFKTFTGASMTRGYFSTIDERRRRDIIRFVFGQQLKKSRLAAPPIAH
jgi:c-di-GMP-binding flagellar brake protein YcgR